LPFYQDITVYQIAGQLVKSAPQTTQFKKSNFRI